MFKGILIEKDDDGYRAALQEIDEAQLPEGDVTINVQYSTLNYKDGLAITGKSPVVRKFPMVPGIDLVGTVESSSHSEYSAGDAWCSTAGVLVKPTGAVWRKKRGSTATGLFPCHRT